MNYTVNLVNFVGPLDLLLRLIEQRDLDITEVSLSTITKDYLYHIKKLEVKSEELNWFSQVASRLLLIKSKILVKDGTADEDQTADDQLADLTKQLEEYKIIQSVSRRMGVRFTFQQYPRTSISNHQTSKLHFKNLTEPELAATAERLNTTPIQPDLYRHVIVPKIPVSSKLKQIQSLLIKPRELNEIIDQSHGHLELIASLLALLELIKRRTVEIHETPNGVVVARCQ